MVIIQRFIVTVYCISMVAFSMVNASDSSNVSNYITDIGKSAAIGYAQPLVTDLGAGMNSGWFISSQPLSMFGKLPFGISIGMVNVDIVTVDNSMKTFNFSGELPSRVLVNTALPQGENIDNIFATLKDSINADPVIAQELQSAGYTINDLGVDSLIKFQARGQPTIFGPDSASRIPLSTFLSQGGDTSKTLKTIMAYNVLQALSGHPEKEINVGDSLSLPFKGLGNIIDKLHGMMFSMPSVSVEVGASKIPVIDNLTLGLRLIPDIDLSKVGNNMPFGNVGLFGFKVQYEYLHWLPFASHLPIKSSVIFAENSMHLGQPADTVYIKQSNVMTGINASADVHWAAFGAGIFTGIGYENSSLDLNVKMSKIDSTLQDFSLTIPGKNHFCFTIGPRFSLGFLEFYGAANFGSVTSYNAGITLLGFNGRGF